MSEKLLALIIFAIVIVSLCFCEYLEYRIKRAQIENAARNSTREENER